MAAWGQENWLLKVELCASGNQAEFTAEINIHFGGRKNIDNPGVLVFPRLLVCSDCGFSRFTMPGAELASLAERPSTIEALYGER